MPMTDQPGHDRRYAIDPSRISSELGWEPRHSFDAELAATVQWYPSKLGGCDQQRLLSGYSGTRLWLVKAQANVGSNLQQES